MISRLYKVIIFLVFSASLFVSASWGGRIFTPAKVNLVQVNNSHLWVDRHEITELGYKQFIYSVEQGRFKSKLSLKELRPDTAGFSKMLCNPKVDKDKLPILGISRAQAEEYCRFRSWVMTKIYSSNLPKGQFRLLTPKEAAELKTKQKIAPGKRCISIVDEKDNSVNGLFDNVEEWLADGKAIVNGQIVPDAKVDPKKASFRCALEY